MAITRVTPGELAAALAEDPALTLIDVRTPAEYAAGHVPGADLMPMHVVPLRVQDLPAGRPVHVVCESGGRSIQVAAWLDQRGYDVVDLEGGMAAWGVSGLPVER